MGYGPLTMEYFIVVSPPHENLYETVQLKLNIMHKALIFSVLTGGTSLAELSITNT